MNKQRSFQDQLSEATGRPQPHRQSTHIGRHERFQYNYEKTGMQKPMSQWLGDGVDHINISPESKSELGRLLQTPFRLKFVHDVMGEFFSISQLWERIDSYATSGRALNHQDIELRYMLADGFWQRLKQYPDFAQSLMDSELPFDMYSYDKFNFPIRTATALWWLEIVHMCRQALKKGAKFPDFRTLIQGGEMSRRAIYTNFLTTYVPNRRDLQIEQDQPVDGAEQQPAPSLIETVRSKPPVTLGLKRFSMTIKPRTQQSTLAEPNLATHAVDPALNTGSTSATPMLTAADVQYTAPVNAAPVFTELGIRDGHDAAPAATIEQQAEQLADKRLNAQLMAGFDQQAPVAEVLHVTPVADTQVSNVVPMGSFRPDGVHVEEQRVVPVGQQAEPAPVVKLPVAPANFLTMGAAAKKARDRKAAEEARERKLAEEIERDYGNKGQDFSNKGPADGVVVAPLTPYPRGENPAIVAYDDPALIPEGSAFIPTGLPTEPSIASTPVEPPAPAGGPLNPVFNPKAFEAVSEIVKKINDDAQAEQAAQEQLEAAANLELDADRMPPQSTEAVAAQVAAEVAADELLAPAPVLAAEPVAAPGEIPMLRLGDHIGLADVPVATSATVQPLAAGALVSNIDEAMIADIIFSGKSVGEIEQDLANYILNNTNALQTMEVGARFDYNLEGEQACYRVEAVHQEVEGGVLKNIAVGYLTAEQVALINAGEITN